MEYLFLYKIRNKRTLHGIVHDSEQLQSPITITIGICETPFTL